MGGAATRTKNLFVTAAFVVFGGPGILVVYLPAWITRWQVPPERWTLRGLAIALFVVGLLPLGESISRFVRAGSGTLSPTHPTETLVISGLYRYVRNPMYIGVLLLIAGECVLFHSLPLWVYLAIVAAGFEAFVVFYEERTLRRKYGGQFDRFCTNVPRWLPRLTPFTADRAQP